MLVIVVILNTTVNLFEVYTHDIRIGELQAVATQTVLYDRDDG